MASRITASILSLGAFAASVSAHAFFHTGYVNDVSQGHLFGVRAPASNSPIQDVTSSALTCNSPLNQPVSTDVIEVAAGDTFGMQWNHNLAGPTAGDADDPIASSHKGPVMVYMAKVDDAATNDGSGLSWFKVAEEGLDTSTGKWGVDTLIAGAGLWSFTMPDLAPGDYLLRGEIIALHSASSVGGAQFYMSCAGIKVTGSGTCSPSDTVSFPGAYSATDPSIEINIYGNEGQPDNGGKAYAIPGPSVASCDGSAPASSSVAASSTTSAATTSVSISASVTTGGNAASSTTTTEVATTTTTKVPEADSTTTSSVLPTTFATVTGSRGSSNSTGRWTTWSRPQNTHTRSSFSLSASSVAPSSTKSHSSSHGMNSSPSSSATTTVAITASATETGVKVPSATATTSATEDAGSGSGATGTSPTTPSPSGTGYPMTGPGGKVFVCYEVTDL